MWKFTFKRLLIAIPTLFTLITVSFFLMRLALGNPFDSEHLYSAELLAHIKADYFLDRPLYEQYLLYLDKLYQGDLGFSLRYKDQSVTDLIFSALPVSLTLGFSAFCLTLLLGIPAGVLAALKARSYWDYLIMGSSMLGIILPSFVLAPLLVLLFSVYLGWFPAGGWNDGAFYYILLPISSLAISHISGLARITRAAMLEILSCDYMRYAKISGISTFRLVVFHTLRPLFVPILAYLSPIFIRIITGSMVIENVFGLSGLGKLFVNGALSRDYPLVLGLTLLIGTLTILFHLLVDILYALLDPRIQYD